MTDSQQLRLCSVNSATHPDARELPIPHCMRLRFVRRAPNGYTEGVPDSTRSPILPGKWGPGVTVYFIPPNFYPGG